MHSWVLGLANFVLLAVLAYIVLNEGQKAGCFPSLLLFFLGLIVFFDLWLGLMFAPRTFAKFFQWFSTSHLHAWAKELGSCEPKKRNDALKALLKMGKKSVQVLTSVLSAIPAKLELVDWDRHAARRLAAKGLRIFEGKRRL